MTSQIKIYFMVFLNFLRLIYRINLWIWFRLQPDMLVIRNCVWLKRKNRMIVHIVWFEKLSESLFFLLLWQIGTNTIYIVCLSFVFFYSLFFVSFWTSLPSLICIVLLFALLFSRTGIALFKILVLKLFFFWSTKELLLLLSVDSLS